MRRYPGAWHVVADHLERAGGAPVFGLPGDDLALLRALESTAVPVVLCRDQRNAVFMAVGYALQSGQPAYCALGKGPAVTNALTGLLEARSSSAPVVVLAGGTGADRRGSGAFQELDQLAVVAPLVKWAHRVDHPNRLCPALEKAVYVATHGAPGPTYLEIPDHLVDAEAVRVRPWDERSAVLVQPDRRALERGLAAIRGARRPVLLIGGGMRHRNAGRAVERLAERIGAALFVTASGRGVVDEEHPLFCGLSGLYAPAATSALWGEADLVIALGSRLEETATVGWEALTADVPVLQGNVEPADMSTERAGPKVLGDAGLAVRAWLRALAAGPSSADPGWAAAVAASRQAAWDQASATVKSMAERDRLHVAEVLAALDRALPADRILVQENGLQDMWSYFYPYWSCGARGGSVVPSEQTSLGFGAAAAAGVKLAAPDRPVVALAGDGAFNLFRSDLRTVADAAVPVLYVVLRNGGYGWLQAQLDRHDPAGSRFRFAAPADGPSGDAADGAVRVAIAGKQDLEERLAGALAACTRKRVAVVDVAVHLDDTPPGIAAAFIDVPGRNDGHDSR